MSDEGSVGGRVELLELHDGGLAFDVTQLSALLLGAPSLSPKWTALSVCRPVSPEETSPGGPRPSFPSKSHHS